MGICSQCTSTLISWYETDASSYTGDTDRLFSSKIQMAEPGLWEGRARGMVLAGERQTWHRKFVEQ